MHHQLRGVTVTIVKVNILAIVKHWTINDWEKIQ